MCKTWKSAILLLCGAFLLGFGTFRATAQPTEAQSEASGLTYVDLVDLADSSQIVLIAQVKKIVRVEDKRAPGLTPGWGRFYITASTSALLSGESAIGESLAYLADLRLDDRGKPPKLKKVAVLLFARSVPGRPGEIQLIARDAQMLHDPTIEARTREVLTQLVATDQPPTITGVRELIHVPGNLAGEGETQIFLGTDDGSAASITVRRYPDGTTAWGASFSELLADIGHPPAPGTLAWFKLACSLPNALPRDANLSETPRARRQAEADYRLVLGELGPCLRNRK